MIKILKNGTVIAFLNDSWESVEPEEATVVKITRPDGTVYFGGDIPEKEPEHD